MHILLRIEENKDIFGRIRCDCEELYVFYFYIEPTRLNLKPFGIEKRRWENEDKYSFISSPLCSTKNARWICM